MEFSKESFIEGFIYETNENLNGLNENIISLKNNPKDAVLLAEILRFIHTIKGTARMMGYDTIEKTAHGMEDVLKGLREEKYELTDNIVQLAFKTSDIIKSQLTNIKKNGTDAYDISKLQDIFSKAASGLFFSLEELNAEKKEYENESFEEQNEITSIRIEISRINSLIQSFDSIIMRQFQLKKIMEDSLDHIPTQVQEELFSMESNILETQHKLLNLRMLPLDMILTPLKKEIEQEAIKSKKNVTFDIPQTFFLVDKVILEQLKNIFLHIIRNSIDHGIETIKERTEEGKSPNGIISIHSTQIANYIKIVISDDGRGIQYDTVRAKAMELYPAERENIENYSNTDLQQYLFRPGFSTKDNPSLLSGRGIGLDVVSNAIEAIKGKLHLSSTYGKGTSFELVIPLTLATQQGLFIEAGGMKFMIPSNYIYEILDAQAITKTVIQDQTFLKLQNHLIPVYYLSSILNTSKGSEETSIIVVEFLETHVGIIVDEVEQYETVIVNPLPEILTSMNSLQGIVFDDNYEIIPILNIPNIMQRLKSLVAYDIKKYNTKNQKKVRTVLIVDDSTTTRQIEQAIFESSGYIVETAIDGIDALELLKNKHVDVIISDIKMPRMDGKMFLNNVRRMEQYDNIPIIIVSGVYDKDAQEYFLKSGAQAYIVKSDFQRGNLIQAVKELLNE
ncbi:MAG: response regulator [Treponema sp.]|nr:response regulator [Treponema sp.]